MELRVHPIVWNANTVRRVLLWFAVKKWGPSMPLFKVREGVHRFIVSDKKSIMTMSKEELFEGGHTFAMLERCAERLIFYWKKNAADMYGKFKFRAQMKALGVNPDKGFDQVIKNQPEMVEFEKYCKIHGALRYKYHGRTDI